MEIRACNVIAGLVVDVAVFDDQDQGSMDLLATLEGGGEWIQDPGGLAGPGWTHDGLDFIAPVVAPVVVVPPPELGIHEARAILGDTAIKLIRTTAETDEDARLLWETTLNQGYVDRRDYLFKQALDQLLAASKITQAQYDEALPPEFIS